MSKAIVRRDGGNIVATAPAAVESGDFVVLGTGSDPKLGGIAASDAAMGEDVTLCMRYDAELDKGTGALKAGQTLWWDATNDRVTTTEGTNAFVGNVIKAVESSDSKVRVWR